MMSRVNLVAILLTLGCVTQALENSDSAGGREELQRNLISGRKITKDVMSSNALVVRDNEYERNRVSRPEDNAVTITPRTDVQERDRPRGRRRRLDKTLMALLLAYKLKFIALIPTMMGGLALLISTALLAGFFFALFAAVLGLRAH